MTSSLNLDAYFHRISYAGSRSPTLETLRALHFHHTVTIPFENFNPLLDLPVVLNPSSLEDKLVKGARGGYCFEQNLLFKYALEALGFAVRGLAARVLWNQPEDAVTARGHMLLRVTIDGRDYLADVGFGGQTLTGPLLLEPNLEQETPHEPFRLVRAGDSLKLQTKLHAEWKTLYRFGLEEQFLVDYEVSNYYLSTNPVSHFKQRLFLARPMAGRRYGLMGNQLSEHRTNGPSERRTLSSVSELRQVAADIFGIAVPAGDAIDAVLARQIA